MLDADHFKSPDCSKTSAPKAARKSTSWHADIQNPLLYCAGHFLFMLRSVGAEGAHYAKSSRIW